MSSNISTDHLIGSRVLILNRIVTNSLFHPHFSHSTPGPTSPASCLLAPANCEHRILHTPIIYTSMTAGESEHAHTAPGAIPFEPAVPGQTGSDEDIAALVAAFEKYDFRNDQEFRVRPTRRSRWW